MSDVKISKTKRNAAIKALGLDPVDVHEVWIGQREVQVHRNQADGTTLTESIPIA